MCNVTGLGLSEAHAGRRCYHVRNRVWVDLAAAHDARVAVRRSRGGGGGGIGGGGNRRQSQDGAQEQESDHLGHSGNCRRLLKPATD